MQSSGGGGGGDDAGVRSIVVRTARPGSWRRTLRSGVHLKCLLSSLLVLGCLCYSAVCTRRSLYLQEELARRRIGSFHLTPTLATPSPPPSYICSSSTLLPVFLLGVLYVLYLIECLSERRKHRHVPVVSPEIAERHVSRLRAASACVCWRVSCYHYARRIRPTTREGPATHVHFEKVTSHRATTVFRLQQQRQPSPPPIDEEELVHDATPEMRGLASHRVVRLRLSRSFGFTTHEMAAEFRRQRDTLIRRAHRYDDYVDVREWLQLCPTESTDSEWHDQLIVVDRMPWWTNSLVYWSASILLLSWPLRIYAELNTARLSLKICKLFGPRVGLSSPTAEQQQLVPSYSQALLLMPIHEDFHQVDEENPEEDEGGEMNEERRLLPHSASGWMRRLFDSTGSIHHSNRHYYEPLGDDPPPSYEAVLRDMYARIRRSISLSFSHHSNSNHNINGSGGGGGVSHHDLQPLKHSNSHHI